jgi:hypothetical protein
MTDYRQANLTGQAWQRCRQIVIDNRRGQAPTVRFDEERVVALDDGSETAALLGTLTSDYDPERVIPLYDPATGEPVQDPETGAPTGAATTYGAVYQILYSAYLHAAMARDAAALAGAGQALAEVSNLPPSEA